MTYFRSDEQRRRRVWTSCDTCAASNASCSIHCQISIFLGYSNRISVRSAAGRNRDESSAGNDAVEGTAIDNQVLDHGKRFGPPRLQVKYVAVLKVAHME